MMIMALSQADLLAKLARAEAAAAAAEAAAAAAEAAAAAAEAAAAAASEENVELKARNNALMNGQKPFVVKINRDTGTIGIGGGGFTAKYFFPLEAMLLVADDNALGLQMLKDMKSILEAHPASEKWQPKTETLCYDPKIKKAYNETEEGIAVAAEKAAKYGKGKSRHQTDIND
jgi:hypothetical protein